MGIWLELGVFVVVLIWAGWQWHDARQALAKTRADTARVTEAAAHAELPTEPPR
jgi:predicted negative regulator of RcsB-dependent stress response